MLLRLLLPALLFLHFQTGVRAEAKPGIVLMTVDGLGWGDLGVSGGARVPTPRLDTLLAQSTVFRDFHVSPLDAPSRAALLTGLHPLQAGVWGDHSGRNRLRPGVPGLAVHLRAAGWTTALFGTWGLGDSPPSRPQDHGYMEVLTTPGGAPGGVADYYSNDGTGDLWLLNGEATPRAGTTLEVAFGSAVTFLEKNTAGPFFCHISPSPPAGMPEEAVQPFHNRADIADPVRAAWIAALDAATGAFLDDLDRLQLTERTIVILTSTTGTPGPGRGKEKQIFNAGRRGTRGSPYDGGHCVPLAIRWPGGGIAAGNANALTAHIDLLPTVAELTGTPLPPEPKLPGISLAPLARGNTAVPARILSVDAQELPVPLQWRRNCVLDGPWRLINGRELYDLRTDPGQRRNIAGTNPDVVQRLRAAGDAWWQSTGGTTPPEPVRIVIGGAQDPVLLTPQDWLARGASPFTREAVMTGTPANAPWPLHIAAEGNYDILLRRWPLTVNKTLSDSFFVPDKARIRIGSLEESKAVPPEATGVNFRLSLKPGPLTLQTWLTGGEHSCGAYFVEIRRAVEIRAARPVPEPE